MKLKTNYRIYNTNAQKYSSYSYEHEKGELYQKILNYLRKRFNLDGLWQVGYKTLKNGYTVTALMRQ